MYRKSYVIAFLMVIGLECLFCQKNIKPGYTDLKPGYIISQNDDTIHGLINYRANAVNSYRCEFTEDKNVDLKIFLPKDIKAFRIENKKYYVSRDVVLDSIEIKLFVEYLIDGIVDLFYIKYKNVNYYLIEKEGTMYRLTNEEKLVEYQPGSYTESLKYGSSQTYTHKTNRYIGIMSIIFNESPEVVKKAQNTSFGYRPLINITKDYHNTVCKDDQCIDYSKSTQQYMCIEAYAGVVFSKIGIKTSNDFVTNIRPLAGVNFRFLPIKSHNLWNIIFGIYYSSNSIENKKMFHDLPSIGVNAHNPVLISMDYSILRTPLFIEYSFPIKKLKPAVSLGISNSFLLGVNQQVNPVFEQQVGEDIIGHEYEMHVRHSHIGIIGGLSLRYMPNEKNYGYINCYYEARTPSAKFSEVMDYQNNRAFIFGVGYGKKFNP